MAGESGRGRGWRAADAVMLFVFAFSAIVQVNDADPLPWISIYALAAVVCLLSILGRVPAWCPALLCAVTLAWAGAIAPRVIARVRFLDMFAGFEMRDTGIEESREMYGLIIIAVWMAVLAIRVRRSSMRRA